MSGRGGGCPRSCYKSRVTSTPPCPLRPRKPPGLGQRLLENSSPLSCSPSPLGSSFPSPFFLSLSTYLPRAYTCQEQSRVLEMKKRRARETKRDPRSARTSLPALTVPDRRLQAGKVYMTLHEAVTCPNSARVRKAPTSLLPGQENRDTKPALDKGQPLLFSASLQAYSGTCPSFPTHSNPGEWVLLFFQ